MALRLTNTIFSTKRSYTKINIVYGNIDSKFILPNLQIVNFNEALHYTLKKNGYNNILFLESFRNDGLFSYDIESLNILGLQPKSNQGFDDSQDPFGDTPTTSETNVSYEKKRGKYLSKASADASLELLRVISDFKNSLCLVIDMSSLFKSNDDQEKDYPSRLEAVTKSIAELADKYRIFYTFKIGDEAVLVDQIRRINNADLNSCLNRNENGDWILSLNNTSKITNPQLDEIERLLYHYHLRENIKINNFGELEQITLRIDDWNPPFDTLRGEIEASAQERKVLDIEQINKILPDKFKIDKNKKSGVEMLNSLIGLKKVKQRIKSLITQLSRTNRNDVKLNFVLTGNTGTGKTIVARIISEVLGEKKFLPSKKFKEVSGKDLIAGYVGQTALKTANVCDQAMGGVLFIDEAYELAQNDFGKEAIATLLKYLEDYPKQISIILAGYRADIDKIYKINDGFKNRFPNANIIHFDDYTAQELFQMAELQISSCIWDLDDKAKKVLLKKIEKDSNIKNFGNGRYIRSLIVDELDAYWSERFTDTNIITGDFLEKQWNINLSSTAISNLTPLEKLEQMIGLREVKDNIQKFLSTAKGKKSRGVTNFSLGNVIFQGNPGTGKTIVANLFGRILKENGLLDSGHTVNASTKETKKGFVGQTTDELRDRCKRAKGGVLFIDEAYTYLNDDFGKNAINDILLPDLENNRNDKITIIAGYENRIKEFLKINEGLKSRFDFTINFPDYSVVESVEIAKLFFKEDKFIISEDVEYCIQSGIILLMKEMKETGESWGNARTIRKIVKKVTDHFYHRVELAGKDASKEEIIPEDVVFALNLLKEEKTLKKEDRNTDKVNTPKKEDRNTDKVNTLEKEDRKTDKVNTLKKEDRKADKANTPKKEDRKTDKVNTLKKEDRKKRKTSFKQKVLIKVKKYSKKENINLEVLNFNEIFIDTCAFLKVLGDRENPYFNVLFHSFVTICAVTYIKKNKFKITKEVYDELCTFKDDRTDRRNTEAKRCISIITQLMSMNILEIQPLKSSVDENHYADPNYIKCVCDAFKENKKVLGLTDDNDVCNRINSNITQHSNGSKAVVLRTFINLAKEVDSNE